MAKNNVQHVMLKLSTKGFDKLCEILNKYDLTEAKKEIEAWAKEKGNLVSEKANK